MTITAYLDASEYTKQVSFNLEDFNYTEEEWLELSDKDKKSAIQQAVDELPAQPYWVLESFDE